MARISYDEQTAAAFKAVREVPRDGLSEWREAVRRHLRPSPGMTLVDIGAGTGAFAAAFSDWFDLSVLAVEPSAAMRIRSRVDGRLPEPVETGAYYTVAEALTNTAKYAHASAVTITVDTTTDTDNTVLRLTVHDDGVGGADLTGGTGLLGLKDRAEALGGHITLHSPPGEGTTLHAQIPLTTA